MLSAHEIAKYFVSLVDEEAGDSISNLKLQKLLYYAQGFSLAFFDRPLFSESIKAWASGSTGLSRLQAIRIQSNSGNRSESGQLFNRSQGSSR